MQTVFSRWVLSFLLLCSAGYGSLHAQEAQTPTPTGYLKILTNVDSFYVLLNRNFKVGHKLRRGDSLQLPVGSHKIILTSRNAFDHAFVVDITAKTTKVYRVNINPVEASQAYLRNSAYPRLRLQANLLVLTDEDSDIYIGKKKVGRGQFKIDTSAGAYKITTRHKFAGAASRKVDVYLNRLEFVELYNKPRRSTANALTIFPGARQLYQNEKFKGLVLSGLFFSGSILAYHEHRDFNKKNSDYLFTRQLYRAATDEKTAIRLAQETQEKYDLAKQTADRRNIFLYVTTAVYALNLGDAFGAPRGGYRDKRPVMSPFSTNDAVGLQYTLHF